MRYSAAPLSVAIWAVSCIVATASAGWLPAIAFGVPCAVLPLVADVRTCRRLMCASNWWITLFIYGIMYSLVFVVRGLPYGAYSVLVSLGPLVWFMVLAALKVRLPSLEFAPLLFVLYFLVGPSFPVLDLATGWHGQRLLPKIMLMRPGPNVALLKRYNTSGQSCLLRIGGNSPDGHSLIFTSEFRYILESLPNDEARRRVVACLTDGDNVARYYQALAATHWWYRTRSGEVDAHLWQAEYGPLFTQQYLSRHMRDVPPALLKGVELASQWRDDIDRLEPPGEELLSAQARAAELAAVRGYSECLPQDEGGALQRRE